MHPALFLKSGCDNRRGVAHVGASARGWRAGRLAAWAQQPSSRRRLTTRHRRPDGWGRWAVGTAAARHSGGPRTASAHGRKAGHSGQRRKAQFPLGGSADGERLGAWAQRRAAAVFVRHRAVRVRVSARLPARMRDMDAGPAHSGPVCILYGLGHNRP